MSEVKFNGTKLRMKRTSYDEDRPYKDEPPFKSMHLYQSVNDEQHSLNPVNDSQFDNSEITEHNYKKIAAITLNKKLQILEIRDRLLRSTSLQPTKEINVDEIKPMEGTCFDMCPEKERLLRIHGNMFSQFECKIIGSKLEPVFEIMVKQYARSSADQANPLSHELRPTSVLVNTMNYMLKNIIHPIESNIEQDLASWYDFCWDRLRAIRKDIVQQNLQNSEVVTILEQIGRFHIACYDLLLGYPGFDIKLNTENLNNCIQMLMPMYRDSDQQCPNEPEFVSYELLMHLGNPQFHTAYDLLPIKIKQSSQVRFCINAHKIYLHSSNCIEFFDLMRSTSYMNCCILQKVIPNIRCNNIKMMNMSYTTVKRVYKLEMKYLIKKLCFNDIQSAQKFCSDIQLQYDDFYVHLSRKINIHALEHRRQGQESIILQKRQNLTFLIAGIEKLPDVIVSSVHSSFDGNELFNDLVNNELNKDINDEILDSRMETDTYVTSSLKDGFSFKNNSQLLSTIPIQTPIFKTPTFTFNLPKPLIPTQVQQSPLAFEKHWEPLKPLGALHNYLPVDQTNTNLSSGLTKLRNNLPNLIPFNDNIIVKHHHGSLNLITSQSPNKIHSQMTKLTEKQLNLAKKYSYKWQNYVISLKSNHIEEVLAHSELFHSECISSLSSSPPSEKSFNYFDSYETQKEPKEWLHKQYLIAEKYFYIWLRKVLRNRKKIEIDPVISMPWSVFMQVHGTPEETFRGMGLSLNAMGGKKQLKIPINHLFNHNETKNNDISYGMADLFIKNVLDTNRCELIGKKIFWKLVVNYGDSPISDRIQKKVQTIIYGKIGFGNNQVQITSTSYNRYLIKSVDSCVGLQDWSKSGLNAAIVFTNTVKENMEVCFQRVYSILKSTSKAIPLVLIFSSSSNKNEIVNYQSVLDAYQEKEYLNNYHVYVWDGPKTILEAIEFFSQNYVDIAPGIHSEKLFYNLLKFAQSFYLRARNSLLENNPNVIIEKYNRYLDYYIKRLGRSNHVIRNLTPEMVPYYTTNPDAFSKENSNFNSLYFEELLNDAHLLPCESWPPQNVKDLIDYIKNMCQLTNRRCWCLDMLQMLQLHRNADLYYCLSNAKWYEIIEMWVEGALEKCSAGWDQFIVFYDGNPITDALKSVFPDS